MVAEIQTEQVTNNSFFLDPRIKCAQAQEFDERLSALIIGQENAVRSMGNLYQLFARHLKRAIERLLVMPMSNLVASGQVSLGDSIYADLDHSGSDISFARRSGQTMIDDSFLTEPSVEEFGAPLHAAQLSQLAAA